mgnify:FL=1
MIDIKYIRENPDEVIARLALKGRDADAEIKEIIALDSRRRAMIASNEQLKAEQNKTSKLIPQYKKEGRDTAGIFVEMKKLSATIKENDDALAVVEERYSELMLGLPNLPDRDLVGGGKENNQPLRYYGEPHKFDEKSRRPVY